MRKGETRKGRQIKGLCPKSEMHCLLKAAETAMNGGTYFTEDAAT
jgi:hypothetical protein